ncbi:MAG TPA: hypothetical protein DIU07_17695 [Rhodobacteraceae bacterium]|nr:hypothetical protein [Paracoccaceae bacterium]
MEEPGVTAWWIEARPLPVTFFLMASLAWFVILIRKEGLPVGQALQTLIGVRRPKLTRWVAAFPIAMMILTLSIWDWLFETCRASLT